MCFSIGTPKTVKFPFVPNGKLMVLGVPIFKHIRILSLSGPLVKMFAERCFFAFKTIP